MLIWLMESLYLPPKTHGIPSNTHPGPPSQIQLPRAHPCEIARVVSDEACNPTFPEIAEVRGKKAMSKV